MMVNRRRYWGLHSNRRFKPPNKALSHAAVAQSVERVLGKDEVMSSNLIGSFSSHKGTR